MSLIRVLVALVVTPVVLAGALVVGHDLADFRSSARALSSASPSSSSSSSPRVSGTASSGTPTPLPPSPSFTPGPSAPPTPIPTLAVPTRTGAPQPVSSAPSRPLPTPAATSATFDPRFATRIPVTSPGGSMWGPALSPDGTRIAWVGTGGATMYDVSGRLLGHRDAIVNTVAGWLPDSSGYLYTEGVINASSEYVAERDGGFTRLAVATTPTTAWDASWFASTTPAGTITSDRRGAAGPTLFRGAPSGYRTVGWTSDHALLAYRQGSTALQGEALDGTTRSVPLPSAFASATSAIVYYPSHDGSTLVAQADTALFFLYGGVWRQADITSFLLWIDGRSALALRGTDLVVVDGATGIARRVGASGDPALWFFRCAAPAWSRLCWGGVSAGIFYEVRDGYVRAVDLASGRERRIDVPAGTQTMGEGPDGRIAVISGGSLYWVDLRAVLAQP